MRRLVATIDPGVTGTGIALWEWKPWVTHVPALPTLVQCVKPTAAMSSTWFHKAQSVVSIVADVLDGLGTTTKTYIEEPQYFQSHYGQTAARDGALVKLCLLTGMLMQACPDVTPIRVNQWKGNVPKTVIENRVRRLLLHIAKTQGYAAPEMEHWTDHEFDAIGLGLHQQGIL